MRALMRPNFAVTCLQAFDLTLFRLSQALLIDRSTTLVGSLSAFELRFVGLGRIVLRVVFFTDGLRLILRPDIETVHGRSGLYRVVRRNAVGRPPMSWSPL